MKTIITIKPDGTIQFIHDDRLRGLLHLGAASIRRASAVEPGDPANGQNLLMWYSDLAVSQGPVLGPFETRQTALDAEVDWINTHILTVERKHIQCNPPTSRFNVADSLTRGKACGL